MTSYSTPRDWRRDALSVSLPSELCQALAAADVVVVINVTQTTQTVSSWRIFVMS